MPVVLRIGPYIFYFWSLENNEPPYIHVKRDKDEAKFWLAPYGWHLASGILFMS